MMEGLVDKDKQLVLQLFSDMEDMDPSFRGYEPVGWFFKQAQVAILAVQSPEDEILYLGTVAVRVSFRSFALDPFYPGDDYDYRKDYTPFVEHLFCTEDELDSLEEAISEYASSHKDF